MAPPKTVLDKIVHAITTLSDPTGSSRVALAKFLKREFDISNATLIKKALAKGVKDGKLTQRGQSFALPGCDFAPPEDERLRHEILRAGDDDARVAGKGDDVVVSYVGTLESDGTEFDASDAFGFTIGAGEVIKGWDQGVDGMRVGERRKLVVPPKLGYGKRGSPPEIPGDATLTFVVTLIAVR
ncbi:uncharacterized protein MICPUCDRAFT_37175 [Micromonas pusilla CCMP1545]|uniref:peptidylprolyl isomerase n=1 Tax=Micromonas pusilla (strain CCMP1545) TaxID=564608 RepID=C1NA25_MICPC|nr:uncharacterized protein MICPUCDRAFT_37175 [Micromonas pusilla CCMP1545]EEH51049.1 predicted protein [Micromonas pusilla CCMP1545]|eukprot:XP_003064715.1 predicted protein [Micromonas pusilla CCMP1545]